MGVGILGYGVYIPKYRIKAEEYTRAWGYFAAPGVSEKSVPRHDEDAVTMAVEASRNAMKRAGIEPAQLNAVYMGSSSSPYGEKLVSSTIATAIGVPKDVCVSDFGASAKAGTAALLSCIDLVGSARGKYGLAVGSDCPVGRPGDDIEHALGAGAAAYIIGSESLVANFEGAHSFGAENWGGRIRRDGIRFVEDPGIARLREIEYEQSLASAAGGLMRKINLKPENFSHAVLQQPDARFPLRAARVLGLTEGQISTGLVAPGLGDTGTSSPLIGLAAVLDKARPRERLLVVSYGSGAGSDALAFGIEQGIEDSRTKAPLVDDYLMDKQYVDYLTYLRWRRVLTRDREAS